ncbi:LCP family protein [uncultured Clostridium sp.]|uniref:LCP family protein n=1 Tax=uncultured Clostridium sp. TaxID=59620 RepID=UPI002673EF9D|nr:LCP family protein [uncultured Clostridium sp.]
MSRKKKSWSTTKKVVLSLVMVLVILIGTVLGFYKHIKNKIYVKKEPSISNNDSEFKEVEGITNVLLIGVDARDLDEPCRSDSMIIATLDNNNKKVKLTSLFRDTLVDIPGHGEAKLNAAYMLGGPELLMKTVKETYNVSIDKYIIINFWGFETIVDYIGGIEVDVKDYQLEELNKYIGESTGGNDCPVEKAGIQTLNGKQALSYARIRYNVGDEYERTDRQREVIFKVIEKLQNTKPSKYLGIMNTMLEYIKTNIDPLEALNMAYTIYKLPSLDVEQLQIPLVALSETRNYKELGSVFLMDRLQNASILYNFIYENKYPNEEEFNYDSLKTELQKYANQESVYNKMYDINPNDYIEAQDGEVKRGNNSMEAPQEPNYVPNEPISAPEEEAGDNSGQVPPNEDSGENIPSTPVPEVPKEPSEGTGDSNSGTEETETPSEGVQQGINDNLNGN